MKKKNILIIGNYPPPYGGVPAHIERLTEHLIDKGWNCHVLSEGVPGFKRIGNLSVYKPTYPRKMLGLIRSIFKSRFRRWLGDEPFNLDMPHMWRHYMRYADVGSEIIKKYDIQLIASYNLLTYAPIGGWLSEEYGLPHIISVFGELYRFSDPMLRSKGFFSHAPRNACQLLSCSDHCGRSVSRIGVSAPVETVTYGIDVEHFSPSTDVTDLKASLELADSPIVLFVGRLGREMGLDSFLTAARLTAQRFTGVRFVMIGQAEDLADEVEKECESSGGRFALMRNVPYADLPKYYRLASIVVVPTRGDRTCSSLVAMEAMATRKPVIAFSIGGIPEIVEHEKTGLLVEPENAQGLATAIGRLLEDNALRNALAEAGYQQAQARFDERLVNSIIERYFLDSLGRGS